jgi:hypothetical protein
MKIIQAPEDYIASEQEIPCFMAGCLQRSEWQEEFLSELSQYDLDKLVVYNPKRAYFDSKDLVLQQNQIEWEFKYLNMYLNRPYIFSLYFDESVSDQPMHFYELGRYLSLMQSENALSSAVVSVHPLFHRRLDILMQVQLVAGLELMPILCTPTHHAQKVRIRYRILEAEQKRRNLFQ